VSLPEVLLPCIIRCHVLLSLDDHLRLIDQIVNLEKRSFAVTPLILAPNDEASAFRYLGGGMVDPDSVSEAVGIARTKCATTRHCLRRADQTHDSNGVGFD
jgi:hypothetical protein